jgi:hypothetical protein
MAFIFDRTNWTVTDAERGIVMQSLGSMEGPAPYYERGGGSKVQLSNPKKWGEEKAVAHLFKTETFPDPEHVHVHWKLYRIYIPESMLAHEHEIIRDLEMAMSIYCNYHPHEIFKITTDFCEYTKDNKSLLLP